MTVETHFNPLKQALTIKVPKRFDANSKPFFLNAVNSITPAMQEVIIDFDIVEFIESSALWMLLLVGEEAISNNQEVRIINTNPLVKRFFSASKLDKLFIIA